METVKLKVGRRVFDISENDIILDNGSCYILITKKVLKDWCKCSPSVSKKLFNDLSKLGFIYKCGQSKEKFDLYKFKIDEMKKSGY